MPRLKTEINNILIEYNDPDVFLSSVVVGMPMRNSAHSICSALKSVLNQESSYSIAAFLINDGSTDDWENQLGDLLNSTNLVIAHTNLGNVCKVRNFIIEFVGRIFPEYQWLGRLDSDDELFDNISVHKTLVNGDRKSTRLNSSHTDISRMPSSA